MLDRRGFLATSLALGLKTALSIPALAATATGADTLWPLHPALAEYEHVLAASHNLELLGRPRCWSWVREGLHPIPPERVVLLSEQREWDGSSRCLADEERRLDRYGLARTKFRIILRLMSVLTDYYQVPQQFERWVDFLARREALMATGFGGFGLVHQFQDDAPVELSNNPVDWWLFLFPAGVDWEALGSAPVYGMLGHIFPAHHYSLPDLKLRVYELAGALFPREIAGGRGKADAPAWESVARLDRLSAARAVNLAIGRVLRLKVALGLRDDDGDIICGSCDDARFQ